MPSILPRNFQRNPSVNLTILADELTAYDFATDGAKATSLGRPATAGRLCRRADGRAGERADGPGRRTAGGAERSGQTNGAN